MPRKASSSTAAPLRSTVPALEKALDVLEVLADAADGLTMSEIAGGLGRSIGEIYRVVIYLCQRGYANQDPASSRYALTLRLFELGHRHPPTNRLVKQVIPILEGIANRTEQSCHLGVLNRSGVLILASAPSPRPAGYSVKPGAVFRFRETSTGFVILAFMPPREQERLLSEFTPADRPLIERRLHKIVRLGHEKHASTLVHGIVNLSAPVFDHAGVIGAITMGFVDQVEPRTSTDEALREVVSGSHSLSSLLGHLDKTAAGAVS